MKKKWFIKKNETTIQYFVCIYFFFLLEFIIRVPLNLIDSYQIPSYILNYKDAGFINRAFIGTISRMIFGEIITNRDIILLSSCTQIIIITILSVFFSVLLGKYKHNKFQNVILLVFIFYWILPISYSAYYQELFTIHLDIYNVLFNLLIIISYFKLKTNLKLVSYLLIACVSLLTHTNFFFMGFPIMLFLLIVELTETSHQKKFFIKAFFLVVFICAFFLIVQFASSISMSLDETIQYITNHYSGYDLDTIITGEEWGYIPYYVFMLQNYYFSDFFTNIFDNLKVYWQDMFIGGIETIIIFSPIIFFLIQSLRNVLKSNNKKLKIVCVSGYIFSLMFLPLFILVVDYGRWFTLLAMYFSIIWGFLFYKYKEELISLGYLEWLQTYITKHKLFICLLIIFYLSLGKIGLIELWPRFGVILNEFLAFIYY